MARRTPPPAPIPADADLIRCATVAGQVMAELAATSGRPLYDPHTLFRTLDRLTPAIRSLAEVYAQLQARLKGAYENDLLVADHEDFDIQDAAHDANASMNEARRALETAAQESSLSEQATAAFAPRAPESDAR